MSIKGLVDYEYSDDDDEYDHEISPKSPTKPSEEAVTSGNSKAIEKNYEPKSKYDDDDRDDEDEDELKTNLSAKINSNELEGILRAIMTQGVKHKPVTPQEYHELLKSKDSVDLLPTSDNFPHLTSMRKKMDKAFKNKEDVREKTGLDLNRFIQSKREFRNPSIYEELIGFKNIDEFGTNFPKDYYDPQGWSKESYYDSSLYKQTDDKSRKRHKASS